MIIELPGHHQCHVTEVQPIEQRIVVIWDVMEDMYEKTLNKPEVFSEDHKVFVAESPLR
jgi:hypothetical protein